MWTCFVFVVCNFFPYGHIVEWWWAIAGRDDNNSPSLRGLRSIECSMFLLVRLHEGVIWLGLAWGR
jgi:hypothetical protein